jgi:hypothetical protein
MLPPLAECPILSRAQRTDHALIEPDISLANDSAILALAAANRKIVLQYQANHEKNVFARFTPTADYWHESLKRSGAPGQDPQPCTCSIDFPSRSVESSAWAG